MTWSTEILDFIRSNNIPLGALTYSPFFHNNENIRKPCLSFNYSDTELTVLDNISKDVLELIPFLKINGNDLVLRDYQKKILINYIKHNNNITVNSRQSGITLINSIFCLHYLMINNGKTIGIFPNKYLNGIDLLDKIKDLYCSLPFFMKPEVVTWNQGSISFSNGNKLKVFTNSKTSGLGEQLHCVLFDDAAFIPNFEKIYKALYPIMSSIKDSKIIISSVPNGLDLFYQLVDSTDKGITNFNLSRIYWTDLSSRDEKWKELIIKDLGSLQKFEQEFNCSFQTTFTSLEDIQNIDNQEILNCLESFEKLSKDLRNNCNSKSIKKIQKELKKIQKLIC